MFLVFATRATELTCPRDKLLTDGTRQAVEPASAEAYMKAEILCLIGTNSGFGHR